VTLSEVLPCLLPGVLNISVVDIEPVDDCWCLVSADRCGRRCAAIVAHNPVCPGCGGLFCEVLAQNACMVTGESRLWSDDFELGKQEVHSAAGEIAGFDDDDCGWRDFHSRFCSARLAQAGRPGIDCPGLSGRIVFKNMSVH